MPPTSFNSLCLLLEKFRGAYPCGVFEAARRALRMVAVLGAFSFSPTELGGKMASPALSIRIALAGSCGFAFSEAVKWHLSVEGAGSSCPTSSAWPRKLTGREYRIRLQNGVEWRVGPRQQLRVKRVVTCPRHINQSGINRSGTRGKRPHVGKKPVSMQRLGSACDLGRASECFEAAAERLRTSFKLFEGSVLQQSSTWAPTKSPPSWSRRNAFEAWMWLGSSCVILDCHSHMSCHTASRPAALTRYPDLAAG
ncbi:hypothetical protein DFH08DRAFT_827064 [Mycena albidolilacea]|uniref:Uncharacterized protein n=1 Tax=Mycena albidolilacea TaxID=1033008 RepID=A0AAD6YZJ6_9AGAR|nr:hypothetical protein DFH08DRAFT_827064 [Mycena albidolilacea]